MEKLPVIFGVESWNSGELSEKADVVHNLESLGGIGWTDGSHLSMWYLAIPQSAKDQDV